MARKSARKPAPTKKKPAAPAARSRSATRSGTALARAKPALGRVAKAAKTPRPVAVAAKPAAKAKHLATALARPAAKVKVRAKPERLSAHALALAQSAEALAGVKPEPRLTAEDTEQLRQVLLDKRAEILGDVSTLNDEALNKNRREASGDLSSMPIHMADLGTDNYEMEFTLGLIEGERAILKEIDEALERIRQGTYGICLATGRSIGKARLRAKPWAKYCYEYTLAQEKGQQRRF